MPLCVSIGVRQRLERKNNECLSVDRALHEVRIIQSCVSVPQFNRSIGVVMLEYVQL